MSYSSVAMYKQKFIILCKLTPEFRIKIINHKIFKCVRLGESSKMNVRIGSDNVHYSLVIRVGMKNKERTERHHTRKVTKSVLDVRMISRFDKDGT